MFRLLFLCFLRQVLVIAVCWPVFAAGIEKTGEVPRSILHRMPDCFFDEQSSVGSVFQRFDESNAVLLIDGQRHLGFSFRLPWGADGPVIMMMAAEKEDGLPMSWLVISGDGKVLDSIESQPFDLSQSSALSKLFPGRGSVQQLKIPLLKLDQRQRYYLLQKLPSDQPAALDVRVSIDSEKGRKLLGKSEQESGAKFISAQAVLDRALKLRNGDENGEAVAYLRREMGARKDDKGAFEKLYGKLYREGYLGGGRMDREWAADLYDMLFMACREHRYYFQVVELAQNTLIALSDTGRHGKKAEILQYWKQSMELGGYRLDISTCPDAGPAFKMLPLVRLRDFPVMLPYSLGTPGKGKPRSEPWEFFGKMNSPILQYAYTLRAAGHWREALEWRLWVRDWAGKGPEGFPIPLTGRVPIWHSSVSGIASDLTNMGFHVEALAIYNKAMQAPYDLAYDGRSEIFLKLSRFSLMIKMDQEIPNLVPLVEELVVKSKAHRAISLTNHYFAETVLANALIHTGRQQEGLTLLDRLVGDGDPLARFDRLKHWVRLGIGTEIEEEFFALLKATREAGNKSKETYLYILYADYLEKEGRYAEAILIRREAIRLCRSFDYFTVLPLQLTKLARVLDLVGDRDGRGLAEADARNALKQGRLPDRLMGELRDLLGKLPPISGGVVKQPHADAVVDLQPLSSVTIPLNGEAWTTYLTLANPGKHAAEGILKVSGVRSELLLEGGRLINRLGTVNGKDQASLRLHLAAGTYQLIEMIGGPGMAKDSEVKLQWQGKAGTGNRAASVKIMTTDSEVRSAIIQAGEYQTNPFYGVPVHHHYVTRDESATSLPLRFVTSEAARVEVYSMDDVPLCVDAQGNGSLRNRGDELFGETDQNGNLRLSLNGGAAGFMVLVYPDGPLPEEGLLLYVEALEDGIWEVFSQNRIKQ